MSGKESGRLGGKGPGFESERPRRTSADRSANDRRASQFGQIVRKIALWGRQRTERECQEPMAWAIATTTGPSSGSATLEKA
ncbi:hypothetical protein MBOE_21380 [Mycolicibacterium boenickei]|uniref:Uncharacterized protein n=1 Tax=Mycolicibacterium boenickei TaxID=146017 RepID=A0ABM7IUH6_9MYCO|nr:hypothetical protein MBOE_21380 [Mycolicibacterium boenickei]